MLCGDLYGKEIQKRGEIYIYIYTHTHTYIYIYIYIWLIHFAVQQKLTQHCKATRLQRKLIKNKQKQMPLTNNTLMKILDF